MATGLLALLTLALVASVAARGGSKQRHAWDVQATSVEQAKVAAEELDDTQVRTRRCSWRVEVPAPTLA